MIEYFCLNNSSNIHYMKGCFNKCIIDENDLIIEEYYDSNINKSYQVYSFICPYCLNKTIINKDEIQSKILKLNN